METNTIKAVPEIGMAENMAYDSEKEKNEISETEITSGSAENSRTEKTFTQKELDDIVRNRLERAKKDIPSKEELEAFREWQTGRAEAEQNTANQLAEAASARGAAENGRRALEIRVACLSRGVSPEFTDDVIALAERYSDENTPIESAVDSVIAKYPVFCGRKPIQSVPGITTGIRTRAFPDNQSGNASFIDIVKENQAKRN